MNQRIAVLLLGTAVLLYSSGGRFASVAQVAAPPAASATVPQPPAAEAPPPSSVAPLPAPAQTPAQTQSQSQSQARPQPQVDESALRYFAQQGDTRRLEAEIARLRALYPNWTPPADPLAVPVQRDAKLDAMWKLYSENKIAEVRKAIADRQSEEPGWQVPADLLDRLAVAEARERIVNASDLKQYDTVIRQASTTPSLLTCGDLDVLWRVAEAFGKTDRAVRALDAYRYVLQSCGEGPQRLATVQKALAVLPREDFDQLLVLEKKSPQGVGEFDGIRDDLARQSVGKGGADPKLSVPQAELARVEALAQDKKQPSDALLLGWYNIVRDKPEDAERWFTQARQAEDSAQASQGLALAQVALGKSPDAEDVLYKWRDENEDTQKTYMAAVANMLAIVPPLELAPDRLARIAAEVGKVRDAAAAQQFGWYADALNQFPTAQQWFETALGWKPGDEPSAYGLTLMFWKLNNKQGVSQMQRLWAGRSDRIETVGQPQPQQGQPAQQNIPRQFGPQNGTFTQQPQQQQRVQPQYAPQPQRYAPEEPGAGGDADQRTDAIPSVPQRYARAASEPDPSRFGTTLAAYSEIQQPAAPAYTRVAQFAQAQTAPEAETVPQRAERAPRITADEAAPARPATREEVVVAQNGPATGGRVSAHGCSSTVNPELLSPRVALQRGWCLLNLKRPLEAGDAFERALLTRNPRDKQDAAYGQSLAYMQAGLINKATLSASKSRQSQQRSTELQIALLAARANDAFQAKRYAETLIALDERARLMPEDIGLMALRGYALLGLNRFNDAEQIFSAAATAGSDNARRGLYLVRERRAERGAGQLPR
ncbi:MAG: cellulose synthase [Methylobacterium mesophilicum]|nr:cellulose synthase [Methylobacterium mesophilicum]